MKTTLTLAMSSLLLLMFAVPAPSQRFDYRGFRNLPNISGTWYMSDDGDLPCRIIQHSPGDRAVFINEHGMRAEGRVYPDHVFVPAWNDGYGSDGLEGVIRGDTIVWANGSYWSR